MTIVQTSATRTPDHPTSSTPHVPLTITQAYAPRTPAAVRQTDPCPLWKTIQQYASRHPAVRLATSRGTPRVPEHRQTPNRTNTGLSYYLNHRGAESMTTDQTIAALDALPTADPELTHAEADQLLLDAVHPDIAAGYRRVVDRAPWWAGA